MSLRIANNLYRFDWDYAQAWYFSFIVCFCNDTSFSGWLVLVIVVWIVGSKGKKTFGEGRFEKGEVM